MFKILKYAKYLELFEQISEAFEDAKVGGDGVEIRPSYKGKQFSIWIKRTK